MRKNTAPPSARTVRIASCSGVIVISDGSGNSSDAASAGASMSHPSPPGRPPAPVQTTSPAVVSSSPWRGSSRARARAAPRSPGRTRARRHPRADRGRRGRRRGRSCWRAPGTAPRVPAGAAPRGRLDGPESLPGGKQPGQGDRRGRLDLLPQPREAGNTRRSSRSTSASHHSVPRPCGRNSPSTTRPAAASRRRVPATTATPSA